MVQCKSLRVYAEYCTNNPFATETLNQVSKSPAYLSYKDVSLIDLASHMPQLTRKSTKRIRLDGLIAKPVQRICKYPLFFKVFLPHQNFTI